jgi:hypothetical protein
MRRRTRSLFGPAARYGLAACAALILAGAASATESTIVRGTGIGKIHVGMTRAQVERVLGKDSLLNDRAQVGSTTYLELGWNFSTFSVGFLQTGSTLRVAQVATTLRGEKTATGIGVGSTFKAAAHAYPQAICGNYFTSMGSTTDRNESTALVVAKDRKQLAFLVRHLRPEGYGDLGPWIVYAVIVRNSIAGAVDFPPSERRCSPGWQQRGSP